MEGAYFNNITNHGTLSYSGHTETLLSKAIVTEKMEVVKVLLKNNVDLNFQDSRGNTALIHSVLHRKKSFSKILIKCGADLNIQNKYGDTAFMIALALDQIDIVKILLDHNVKVDIPNKENLNAIDVALYIEHKEIRKEILNKVDITYQHHKKEDSDIETFLYRYGKLTNPLNSLHLNKNNDIQNTGKSIWIDNRYGIDTSNINLIDIKGETILMKACSVGDKKLVYELLNLGADIFIEDNQGNTAEIHARYSENPKEIIETLREFQTKSSQYKPKELIKILTNFRKDTPMKYTTHDWDMNFDKEYTDFDGYIDKVTKQWYKIEHDLKVLSPHIHKKIHTFLIEKNPNTKDHNWCSKEGDNIPIGWSSLDGLKEWCNEGHNPFDFILKEPLTIEGQTITTFGEVRNLFKQEIQIRNENNMLENIFLDIEEKYIDTLDIQTIKLKGKSFYTDVEYFKNVLNRIFSEMNKREAFNEINVEIIEDNEEKYIDLKITHIGSEANRSIQEMITISDGGDMASIKESLTNLCYWSVESSNEEENYRINYLKNFDEKESEILDYKPEGFTHILRFYK